MEYVDELLAELQAITAGAQPPPSADKRARHFADPAPEQRGFLLPLRVPRGGYQTDPGTVDRFLEGLAVPGIIHEPFQAASQLLSPAGQYRPGTEDAEGVALALQAAGIGGAGALATRPANALTAGFARRSQPSENALTTRRGLPTDLDSRMSRAEGMSFDASEPLYHGTWRSFRSFDPSRAPNEQAVWLTPDAEAAGFFGQYNAHVNRLPPGRDPDDRWHGVRVMPLYARPGKQKIVDWDYVQREYGTEIRTRTQQEGEDFSTPLFTNEDGSLDSSRRGTLTYSPEFFAREVERARQEGFDSLRFVRVDEGMGPPADQIAVLDPVNVRSTNARFNPRYSRSANLLSANAPPAALPTLLPAEHD